MARNESTTYLLVFENKAQPSVSELGKTNTSDKVTKMAVLLSSIQFASTATETLLKTKKKSEKQTNKKSMHHDQKNISVVCLQEYTFHL